MLRVPSTLILSLAFTLLASRSLSNDDARMYELKIETSMPHLEESLRYTNVTTQRCLSSDELVAAFPVLAENSLRSCRLQPQHVTSEEATYTLQCNDSSGTSGAATWLFGASRMRGTLDVKLGGKNMTFSQRVSARSVGECREE